MNGADTLLQTLVNNGVEVCFTNPGTSEMHMVAAIGESEGMRSILCLFEGICSGAADGYMRMAGKPACTLLHLGPGLSNASANLHNARKAHSAVLNLVGDHATYHKQYDAPLNSDVEGLAAPVSHWVKTVASAGSLAQDAADALHAAAIQPGQISTLIVPADCAWNEAETAVRVQPAPIAPTVDNAAVELAAELLGNGKPTIILMSNMALTETGLALADQIAQQTGARVFSDTFDARLPRGAGRCQAERLGYFAEQALEQIGDAQQFIMVGTNAPVAFFAYPEKASRFTADDATLHTLAEVHEDAENALQRLVDAVGAAQQQPRYAPLKKPGLLSGELSPKAVAFAVAEFMPQDCIVADESGVTGGICFPVTSNTVRHDWLRLSGGSIGYGLPCAIGAAVACPDRKVLCLHGDGGAMYTIQSLWTMAREQLDICVVIFANRKYQILQVELSRVGADSVSPKTLAMMDLSNPDLDFVQLAQGMGVQASTACSADEFNRQFEQAMAQSGPCLIEAVLP